MDKRIVLFGFILMAGIAAAALVATNYFSSDSRHLAGIKDLATEYNFPEARIIPTGVTTGDQSESLNHTRRNAIVQTAEMVGPAVVSLTVTQERVMRARSPMDDFYSEFWGWYVPPRKYVQKIQSLGSGVIIDPDGHILTNAHVVEDAKTIRVILPRGDELEGKVIGLDHTSDLAVIKIDGNNLPYAKLGDSDGLIIGEWAIAFGNPFGFLMEDTEPTVTAGVISALHRDIKRDPDQVQIFKDMIQTDAAINPGNSGGPLANALGEVIGINTFIFTSSRGSEGVGFAIPINRAKAIVKDLIEHGEVIRAWVGVYIQNITPLLAQSLDLPITKGVIIVDTEEESPAEEAGLQRADIILKADNNEIKDGTDWEEFENLTRPGKKVQLQVLRKGREIEIGLTPMEALSAMSNAQLDKFGLYVSDLTSSIQRQLKSQDHSGVVIVKIDPNSRAVGWDIQSGDIIRQIGRLNVTNAKEYFNIIKQVEKGDRFTLVIERKSQIFYLTLRY